MANHERLYCYSRNDAKRSKELDSWTKSYEENCRCARAIEKTIADKFKNNSLEDGTADIIREYGFNRVNYVLANTIQCKKADGRIAPENKEWAKDFYIPKESYRYKYCVESHPGLVDIFTKQARKAWDDLGLFDYSHCEDKSRIGADYTDKVLVINPRILIDQYKTPEDQLFLAESGFGCSPTASGRKVFGRFLKDGEKAQFYREDFLGVLSEEHLPEWAKEKLEEFLSKENTQTDSVTMGGM